MGANKKKMGGEPNHIITPLFSERGAPACRNRGRPERGGHERITAPQESKHLAFCARKKGT